FFFQAEDGIRDFHVTGVQTCALPISLSCLTGSGCSVYSSPWGSFPPATFVPRNVITKNDASRISSGFRIGAQDIIPFSGTPFLMTANISWRLPPWIQ